MNADDELLHIRNNIFDLTELHCEIYMRNPSTRRIQYERVVFYLNMLAARTSLQFGRLYSRMKIIEFFLVFDEYEKWTKNNWEAKVNELRQLKSIICRNDACLLIVPEIKGASFRDPSATIDIESLEDASENEERDSYLVDHFRSVELQMEIQKRLKFMLDADKRVNLEFLDKHKTFITKCLKGHRDLQAEYLLYHKILQNSIERQNDNQIDSIEKDFKEYSTKCFACLKDRVEKLLLKCYNILPSPTLTSLKYCYDINQEMNVQSKTDSTNNNMNVQKERTENNSKKEEDKEKNLFSNEKLASQVAKDIREERMDCNDTAGISDEHNENSHSDNNGFDLKIGKKRDNESTSASVPKVNGQEESVISLARNNKRKLGSHDDCEHSSSLSEPKEKGLEDKRHSQSNSEMDGKSEVPTTTRQEKIKKVRDAVEKLQSSAPTDKDPLDKAIAIAKGIANANSDQNDCNSTGREDESSVTTLTKEVPNLTEKRRRRLVKSTQLTFASDEEISEASSVPTCKPAKRRRRRWIDQEDRALKKGVKEFGLSWQRIKEKYAFELMNRTNVNIKDRYRTLRDKGAI